MSLVQRYGTQCPRETRRTRHRNPDEPRRPMSSYILFCNDHRAEITRQLASESYNGLVRGGLIGKRAGQIWKRMTSEEKQPYIIRAAGEQERYRREMADYERRLTGGASMEVSEPSSDEEYSTASEELSEDEDFSDASSTTSASSSGDDMSVSGDDMSVSGEYEHDFEDRLTALEARVSVLEAASATPTCPEVSFFPVADFNTRRLKNFKPVNLFIRANRDQIVDWELSFGTRRGIDRKEMVKIVDKTLKRLWRTMTPQQKCPFESQALRLHENYVHA